MSRLEGFVLLCALLGSCASSEGIQVRIMRPAPVDLRQYDVVAVDRFAGSGCDQFANDLADALRNSVNPLTGKADFQVVDRRDVDRMLEDLRGRSAGGGDDRANEVLRRWRESKLVLKGELLSYQVHEEIVETPFVDPRGVSHVDISRRAVATVTVKIEAHDTAGGRVFDSVRFHEVVTAATSAVDAEPRPIDHGSMLTTARRRVVGQYMRRVQPHEDVVWVNLYVDGDLPQLQVGNGFAKVGDWNAALESYREAVQLATGDLQDVRYKALSNQGVAQAYTNQFDAARQSLKEAYALGRDESILRQLQNVSHREQEFQRLMEQSGRPSQPAR